jgi:hypothetical protein
MIDFFHEGSNIGFSLSGVSGFLLLFYLLIEFSFFIVTKTFLIHKFFLGLRVRYQIKKILPYWWYIEKISYLTINKVQSSFDKRQGEYQIYVKVRSKIPTVDNNTCTDWIEVNWLGTIKRKSLMVSIFVKDNLHQSQIKQWSREKTLEKLGI